MSTLPTGIIFDIKKFSIHDGPGIRTTVFLKGCPLHCSWCHNPEGITSFIEIYFWENRCIACHECVEVCETGALSFINGKRVHDSSLCQVCGACAQACPTEATEIIGMELTVETLMEEIQKDIIYYDQSGGGVTFSGGEPLLQVDFLEQVLQRCQDIGIHTTIDTAGYVPRETLTRVLPYTDLFLYDIKIIDSDKHYFFTGVHNHRILENLKLLVQGGAQIIPRIPIIPGINDDDENIIQTGTFLRQLSGITQINILPYHRTALDKHRRIGNHYPLESVNPPSEEHMVEIAWQLESFGCQVTIGG